MIRLAFELGRDGWRRVEVPTGKGQVSRYYDACVPYNYAVILTNRRSGGVVQCSDQLRRLISDTVEQIEERAAIMQHDGGLDKRTAELRASCLSS